MIRAASVFSVVASTSLALALGACSAPKDSRIGVLVPNESTFPPVADLLAYRCGSLDCHGSSQRNFVIWSCYGLRLDPNAIPGCDGKANHTSPGEYDRTFRSLVGLEPAVMSGVVASNGANPDELTLVRKARGEEAHKGGTLFVPGDVQDQCVAQWLSNSSATATTCASALSLDESTDAGAR
ncbi:MAG TPA: hypothetical protein VGI39_06015 [Polyangiaceae bacterium]|jgi:hypothetical protein